MALNRNNRVMIQIKDNRVEHYLNDIKKYEKLENLLAGQSLTYLFYLNVPVSALVDKS